MNIKDQISEVAADENHFSQTGLCESGFDIADLKALADSHTKLLEAAKYYRRVDAYEPTHPGDPMWTTLDTAIEEAEKL